MKCKVPTLIVVLLAAATVLHAQIPRTFSLQGMLTDAAGNALADGNHQIRVALYTQSSGGSALFTETHSASVKDGTFGIIVGSVTPIPGTMLFDRQYYAGISIDGGAELSPRMPVTAAPYALNAAKAAEATALAAGATGVVTNVNGADGALTLQGAGGTSISRNGSTITITSSGGSSTGIAGLQNTDGTIAVTNPNGPVATIGVAPQGITSVQLADGEVIESKLANGNVTENKLAPGAVTAQKLADASVTAGKIAPGAVSLDKLNTSGAQAGQVPTFNGSAVNWESASGGNSSFLPVYDTVTIPGKAAMILHNTAWYTFLAIGGGGYPGVVGVIPGAGGAYNIPLAGVSGYSGGTRPGAAGHSVDGPGLDGKSDNGIGVSGSSMHETGVQGYGSIGGNGVVGIVGSNWKRGNVGVLGYCKAGEGVCGESESGIGVRGWSQTGDGVVGRSNSGTGIHGYGTSNGPAVHGETNSSQPAMRAENTGSGTGLVSVAESGIGLQSLSSSGTGLYATSSTGVAMKARSQSGDIIEGYSGTVMMADLRFRVTSSGYVRCDGQYISGGADVAEAVDFEGSRENYEPGDVLVISPDNDRHITLCSTPNARNVAGVYATKPGVMLTTARASEDISHLIPLGVLGIIPTKVCAENGPIRRGDLLVTSSTPGHAMKAVPVIVGGMEIYPTGAVLGKALQNYEGPANGVIEVLVNVK